jgi:hypothetical protein
MEIGHEGLEAMASRAGQSVGIFIHDNIPAPVLQALGLPEEALLAMVEAVAGPDWAAGVGTALIVLPGPGGKLRIWSRTSKLSPVQNAFKHWRKHRAEFPEFQNAKQYVEGARRFFSRPPSGTLVKTRANGERVFYNPSSNTFGVQAADGTPMTLFRPDPSKHGYPTNLDYYDAQ